jgi:hypothetical protein
MRCREAVVVQVSIGLDARVAGRRDLAVNFQDIDGADAFDRLGLLRLDRAPVRAGIISPTTLSPLPRTQLICCCTGLRPPRKYPVSGVRFRLEHAPELRKPRYHGGARAYSKFGEDTPQMGANGPGTDIEDNRNDLVLMPLGNHSHDLLLAWAQWQDLAFDMRHSDQNISVTVKIDVENDLLVTSVGRHDVLQAFAELCNRQNRADQIPEAILVPRRSS